MSAHKVVEDFVFESQTKGPTLLVFGAIHGDEPCGPLAISRIKNEIGSGALVLSNGKLRLVPVSNPRAYSEGKRHTGENLNRVFKKSENPDTYEARLANTLCEFVDGADVLLDIHSSLTPCPVNLFVDYPTPSNQALADALGAEIAIYDWPKVYEESSLDLDSFTTDRYAFEAGKVGILIEAGQHTDLRSVDVAYEAILRALIHLGMIAQKESLAPVSIARKVHMTQVLVCDSDQDVFTENWTHLQTVPAGTAVATRASGEVIAVTKDSVIIFPKTYAKPGDEWFYLGYLG